MPEGSREQDEWPHARGEMARRIRGHDWAATPLGARDGWPDRLKHAVELVLAMPYPAAVCWGPDLLQLYNDRLMSSYGDRHPAALGRPLLENFTEAADTLRDARDRLFASGEAIEYQDRPIILPGTDGETVTRWFTGGWAPIRDDSGAVLGLIASGVDTTARAHAQAELSHSEERLARVLDQVPVGVGLFDDKGRFRLRNAQLRALIGDWLPSLDDANGHRWTALDAAGRPVARNDYPGARALRGEETPVAVNFRHLGDDGERWVRVTAAPLRGRGATIGGITVVQDVTEERRVQQEISALALRNSETLESISDAFYAVDAQARFTYVNRRAEEWWGRTREDLLGKVLWEEFPDAVGTAAQDAHRRAAETKTVVRQETLSPVLGRWIDMSVYPTADGGLSVYFRDITDRKAVEDRLRASEARLVALAQASAMVHFRVSPDWRELRELSGRGFLADDSNSSVAWLVRYIPSSEHAVVIAAIDAAIRGKTHFELEHRVLRPDGSIGWTLSRAVPILGDDGAIREWFGAASDITDRRDAEERLRESEERNAFLLRLADVLRPLTDPAAIQGAAARVLGEHLDAGRAYYVEVDQRAGDYVVAQDWHRPGETSHARRFPMTAWSMPWLVDGKTWVVRDTGTDLAMPDDQRELYRDSGIGALIVVPLIKDGQLVATCLANQRAPRDWTPGEIRLVEEVAERTWAALERARTEATLRETEERSRAILDAVRDYAIFTTDAEGRIETWPPGAEAVFGWTAEEAIGQDVAMTFVPEDRADGAPERERAEAAANGFAANIRWHARKGGERVFIEGSTRPMTDPGARPHGFLKVGQDVTERRQWEDRQKILVAELQHRTRNLMGVIRSMFDKTRRGSTSVDDLAATYTDRLAALARVQGLLSRLNDFDRIAFDELIIAELRAMGAVDEQGRGERVTLDGPHGVLLRSSTVQTFALALHELATNASKYGALAQPDGRLLVRWQLTRTAAGPRLRIEWVESGVHMPDPGSAPQGSGYGRELIERALPYQLDAKTRFELAADGVRCTMELAVSESTRVGVEYV